MLSILVSSSTGRILKNAVLLQFFKSMLDFESSIESIA